MNLIKAVDTTSLRLTSLDDEIYNHFTETFPDFNIENIDVEMLKSAEAKEKVSRIYLSL